MVALTNSAREGIKRQALESINAMISLKPSDDGMSLEDIGKAIRCLQILVNECDSEIRRAEVELHKSRRNK